MTSPRLREGWNILEEGEGEDRDQTLRSTSKVNCDTESDDVRRGDVCVKSAIYRPLDVLLLAPYLSSFSDSPIIARFHVSDMFLLRDPLHPPPPCPFRRNIFPHRQDLPVIKSSCYLMLALNVKVYLYWFYVLYLQTVEANIMQNPVNIGILYPILPIRKQPINCLI